MDAIRELDHRHRDGIDVRLLWDTSTNHVFIEVVNARLHEELRIDVEAVDALDAFHHPYAYQGLR
jgi:hypothetical protein